MLTHPLWSTANVLSEDSALGDIFHSFFGYAQSPTLGQVVVYLAYLGIAIGAFVGWRHPRRAHPRRVPSRVEGAGRAVTTRPYSS